MITDEDSAARLAKWDRLLRSCDHITRLFTFSRSRPSALSLYFLGYVRLYLILGEGQLETALFLINFWIGLVDYIREGQTQDCLYLLPLLRRRHNDSWGQPRTSFVTFLRVLELLAHVRFDILWNFFYTDDWRKWPAFWYVSFSMTCDQTQWFVNVPILDDTNLF